jgi:hypothetical protein
MSVIHNDLLLSTDEATGYNLTKSVRLRSSATGKLSRTPSSTSSTRTKITYSGWIKRGKLGTYQSVYCGNTGASTDEIRFNTSDQLEFLVVGGSVGYIATTAVYRDPSAWYHIVAQVDTTQATAANRMTLWVNGVQVPNTPSPSPSQNYNLTGWNISGQLQTIGVTSDGSSFAYDGEMTEIIAIDGQALTPSSFGETDTITGVWKPKRYTGTYGTNGFYLPFTDVATTSGSNAGLGKDFSGNGNYWTTNNISVTAGSTYDSMTDVPTLTSATAANYCVLNPLNKGSIITLDSGNLNATSSSGTYGTVLGTIGSASGKYYWEVLINSSDVANAVGIGNSTTDISTYIGKGNSFGYANTGIIYGPNDTTSQSGLATFTTNDIIGVALNLDASEVKFYKNNTLVTTVSSLSATTWFPAISDFSSVTNLNVSTNFGQRPFSYTPPSGFKALNTYNLPDSTIVAGNKVMDATTYSGTSATHAIVNAGGFKPDLVWIKSRTNPASGYLNILSDSVRGQTSGYYNNLYSDATYAENVGGTVLPAVQGGITTLSSNGFTIANGSAPAYWQNESGYNYVAWQWQAGQGTTSSNTSGSITSTVSVNASAGFSVVTYTAPNSGSAYTVGHGLGVAPSFIITKERNSVTNWSCYHASIGNTANIFLNTTSAINTTSGAWNNTSPTSSVWTMGSSFADGSTQVAYCWAEIAGFSKFGSYVGNGSADGPFVYTGFRPKFVMIKSSSGAFYWVIEDSTRNSYNAVDLELFPNDSLAETNASRPVDFLSNGFKIRHTGTTQNSSGGSYIYAAYAENPLKNSLAR